MLSHKETPRKFRRQEKLVLDLLGLLNWMLLWQAFVHPKSVVVCLFLKIIQIILFNLFQKG